MKKVRIEKKYRKAVFIVVYRLNNHRDAEYIILKRKKHWSGWEFPKGGVEISEREIETARRECMEECGLNPFKIKQFNVRGKYFYKKRFQDRPGIIGQSYSLFSCQVGFGKVQIDKREHSGFMWMSFKDALKKLTHANQKKCLKIVNRSLNFG